MSIDKDIDMDKDTNVRRFLESLPKSSVNECKNVMHRLCKKVLQVYANKCKIVFFLKNKFL